MAERPLRIPSATSTGAARQGQPVRPVGPFVEATEIARRLGVDVSTVYAKAARGTIPGRRERRPDGSEGRRWLFYRDEVEEFFAGRTRRQPGPAGEGLSREDVVEAIREALDGLSITIAITRQERTRAG